LPNGVFNPYTGIKTNLLFFEKGTPTKDIWYFEHPYPAGVKSYNKGKPINIKEFDLEKAWWNKREENKHAWKVSAEEIAQRNFNLDIKNPHQEADDLDTPEVILEKYRATESKIESIQNEIVKVLTEALK
jgi:type I restriction enzyme M protein